MARPRKGRTQAAATRREFLQTSAAVGAGFFVANSYAAEPSKSPNERVRLACIGVGGKGGSDTDQAAELCDLVALCDCDENTLNGKAKKFDAQKPKLFTDFRKLFDEVGKSIDAVTVSTPDHTHAPAAMRALRMGIHTYVQKPLSHTVIEARIMRETAAEKKLATQMGNQALIVGWVNVHVRASGGYPARIEHLGQHAIEEDLLATNVVANSAVLAPKAVLDEVGLYDPHVSLARLCDYDLWLRARRKVAIRFIDLCVGDERGPATLDSLGSTYPLDHWTADDRMRQHRDELLRPDVFGEIDVFDQAGFSSDRSRALVARLAHDHRSERAWISEPSRPQARASGVPRVMVLAHPIDASTLLVFEAMRDDPRLHVRIIDPTLRSVVEVLEANALIAAMA